MAQATFNILNGTDDNTVVRTHPSLWPPVSTTTWTPTTTDVRASWTWNAAYEIRLPLLAFDTSSLGVTAEVIGATLRIRPISLVNADGNGSMTWGWYDWDGVSSTDWTSTPDTNAHAGRLITSMNTTADQDFTLLNPQDNVRNTGITRLRGGISGIGTPTGINVVFFAALEHATLIEARLIVDYNVVTVQSMPPNIIISRTNLPNVNGVTADDATALAAIDEDPDAPDANWLTV